MTVSEWSSGLSSKCLRTESRILVGNVAKGAMVVGSCSQLLGLKTDSRRRREDKRKGEKKNSRTTLRCKERDTLSVAHFSICKDRIEWEELSGKH